MQTVIYGDILFLVNFIINFILLWITGTISRLKYSNIRLIIAAVIGALYSVYMFFPPFEVYYTVLFKLLFSLLLIAVAYNIGKVKKFFRVLIIFYTVNFLFAGIILCLTYFTSVGSNLNMIISNGVFYFNLPWKMLFFSSAVAYVIITVIFRVSKNKYKSSNICVVVVRFGNETVNLEALFDTGNFLYDPISNLPVVVVEYRAIKGILPERIKKIFEDKKENDLTILTEAITNTEWFKRFRLIPFSSLGNEKGMMLGFKPDSVEIFADKSKKEIEKIIIGICNGKISTNESYCALLHPEVMI